MDKVCLDGMHPLLWCDTVCERFASDARTCVSSTCSVGDASAEVVAVIGVAWWSGLCMPNSGICVAMVASLAAVRDWCCTRWVRVNCDVGDCRLLTRQHEHHRWLINRRVYSPANHHNNHHVFEWHVPPERDGLPMKAIHCKRTMPFTIEKAMKEQRVNVWRWIGAQAYAAAAATHLWWSLKWSLDLLKE